MYIVLESNLDLVNVFRTQIVNSQGNYPDGYITDSQIVLDIAVYILYPIIVNSECSLIP